jgi:hypothetical protein
MASCGIHALVEAERLNGVSQLSLPEKVMLLSLVVVIGVLGSQDIEA